jgi:hypothetical protein
VNDLRPRTLEDEARSLETGSAAFTAEKKGEAFKCVRSEQFTESDFFGAQ